MKVLQPFSTALSLYSNVKIDKVLKLKGLKIKVAGSSFKISMKTKRKAMIKLE